MQQKEVIFREVQRFHQIWAWILVLGVAGLMWYGFIQQIVFETPFGDNPAPDAVLVVLWLLFGIAFPIVFFGIIQLIVEVREDGVYVRYIPFHRHYKPYLFQDIVHYESITYSPIMRFGGWGLRFNTTGERAYNISGNQGIELKLKDHTVVIGSRHPDHLIQAIDRMKKGATSRS